MDGVATMREASFVVDPAVANAPPALPDET